MMSWGGILHIAYELLREGLFEEVAFEQRPKKRGGDWNQLSRHLGVECCRQMDEQVQLFWERIKSLLLEGQQGG